MCVGCIKGDRVAEQYSEGSESKDYENNIYNS